MANQEHLDVLEQGVETWNEWRKEHTDIRPDLSDAILVGADLCAANLSEADLCSAHLNGANLSRANLSRANLSDASLSRTCFSYADLSGANLNEADLKEADLSRAHLKGVHLNGADLSRAQLEGAHLSYADLSSANLNEADLKEANLSRAHFNRANLCRANLCDAYLIEATFVRTNLTDATLTQCHIYGIAAWSVELEGARQNDLVITPDGEPTITVDNLEVAQFIYLLLNNPKIRDVIDTIARKAVLILGRFTPERKAVLDTLREALRTHGYVPILFDFDRPSSRNVTETVKTLAHLSRFIIADLTDPSSIPYELAQVVPGLAIPVQPVLLEGKRAFAMFPDLPGMYHWVLPIHYYTDQAHLLATLQEQVIEPAEQKAQELEK